MKLEFEASRRTFIKTAAILSGLGALLGIGGPFRGRNQSAPDSTGPSDPIRPGLQIDRTGKKVLRNGTFVTDR